MHVDVAQERTHYALIAGVTNFKSSSLKRTNTREKIVLPNAQGKIISKGSNQLQIYMAYGFNNKVNAQHINTSIIKEINNNVASVALNDIFELNNLNSSDFISYLLASGKCWTTFNCNWYKSKTKTGF